MDKLTSWYRKTMPTEWIQPSTKIANLDITVWTSWNSSSRSVEFDIKIPTERDGEFASMRTCPMQLIGSRIRKPRESPSAQILHSANVKVKPPFCLTIRGTDNRSTDFDATAAKTVLRRGD